MSGETRDSKNEYRNLLIQTWQKSQDSYDKAVLTLSAGALAISLTFIKDIVGGGEIISKCYLISSWVCWAISTSFMLISFYTSILAQRHAVKKFDEDKLDFQKPGGPFDKCTHVLNIFGGASFLLGTVFFIIFVFINM